MTNVVRIADMERRSRNLDAMQPRDPCDCDVIVLPVIRVERNTEVATSRQLPSVFLPDNDFSCGCFR